MFYNYYRDYDPSTGRYLQSDPIGLNGGLNTYGYVLQNPLRYIDPFGLVSSLDSCTGHNAVACAEAGISSRVPGAINTGGVALCFLFGICSANESSEEGECPPVPEDYTGENLRGDGKTNLSGGEKARDRIFGELTGGNHVTDENGHKVAPNGVRSRTGRDGRLRIDIPAPASGNRGPETIHFNP